MAYDPEQRAAAFISRLGRGATPELIADIKTAFGIPAAAGAKAAAIRRDTSLSPSGHKFQIARILSSGLSQQLAQLKGNASRQLEEARAARKALMPQPGSDIIMEMRRAEMRTLMRGLSHADRMRVIYETTDPLVLEAAAFAPPTVLSGISEDLKAHAVDALIRSRHGDKVDELDAKIATFETAGNAFDLAEADVPRETGLSAVDVAQATPIAAE